MSDLVLQVTDSGWMYFDWNIDSGDAAGNNVAKKKLIANVEKGLTDTENVVLMHDTSTKQTTADALQKIIDDAKNKGYTIR